MASDWSFVEQRMNKKDFPAAHSMDSTWFAVDEEGHVAEFETGEAGCMPESAGNDEGGAESLLGALVGIDPNQIEFYADDLCTSADGQAFQFSWRSMVPEKIKLRKIERIYSAILWLKDDSVFDTEQFGELPEALFGNNPSSYSRLIRLPNHKYVLAFANGLDKKSLLSFIKQGSVNRTWLGLEVSASRLGFYSYSHGDSFENWIAGPFVKDQEPANPIKFEGLPEPIKKMVGSLRFQGVNFKIDHAVDAYQHDRCHSWGSRFVSLTGQVQEEIDDHE